jgi:multiple sugar transport system substrate-binding protein
MSGKVGDLMRPIEFTQPSHDEDAQAILRGAMADFQQSHRHVPLNITTQSWTSAWNDLVRVALYRDGAEVSEVGSTWLGSFVGMEALRPFNVVEVSRVGRAAAFVPSAWQNTQLLNDERIWAIPWLSDTRVIFYWRDMLEHAGVDEAGAFQTFDQLEETLARLLASGSDAPWAMTTRRTANTVYNISSWLWGAGGDFMSADGQQTQIAEPAALAGLTRYFGLHRYLPQSAEPLDGIACFELFQNQRVAAILSGPWFMKWLRSRGVSPDTMSRVGVAQLPGPAFVGGTNLVIWKHVAFDHEQLAAELVHYLVTSPALLPYYHQVGLLPARRDLLAQPPFSTDPHYQEIIAAMEQGRTHSHIALWGLVEDRLTATLAQLWHDLRANPAQDIAALVASSMEPLAQRLNEILSGRR